MNDHVSRLAAEANAYYEDLLRPVFAGRRFLIAAQIAASEGLGGLARRLTRLGAERPFLLAGSEGTGALPAPEEAELRVLGIQSTDVLEDFRNLRRALQDLPADVRRDIDAWDPAGTARFIFASPLADSVDVSGRKAYASLHPAWAALEDKVQIDDFWDAVGMQRADSRIVATDFDALSLSCKRAGPSALVRYGRPTPETAPTAAGWAWAGCDTSTTDGSPSCRCAGWRTGYASCRSWKAYRQAFTGSCFRTRWRSSGPSRWSYSVPGKSDHLHYAGCATAFDPLPGDRQSMRDLAYRVGAALRETVDYRGPFGIDGILAEDGYGCAPR